MSLQTTTYEEEPEPLLSISRMPVSSQRRDSPTRSEYSCRRVILAWMLGNSGMGPRTFMVCLNPDACSVSAILLRVSKNVVADAMSAALLSAVRLSFLA